MGLAVAFIDAISDLEDVPYTISSDSSTAIGVAQGNCQYQRFPELSALVRAIGEEALATGRVVLRHVKAHNGDPWNEMADSVAKYYTAHRPQTDVEAFLEQRLSRQEHI